jgi:hypothetical protein
MADFLQILRNTLADVDGAFRTARQDLEEVVGKANDAVHALSQGRVRLRLDELKKDPDSVVLGLYLVRDAQTKQDVGAFGIPSLGYPIAYGDYNVNFRNCGVLQTKDDLEKHFAKMLSERSSPPVVALAFLLRGH